MAPIRLGASFDERKMAVGPSAPPDDGDCAGLIGLKSKQQCYHVGAEDTKLGGGTDEHQLGVGDQGSEVGHGTYAEEDQRRIPSGRHSVVEDVEHRAFLVDADFKSGRGVERDVADQDTKSDGNEQHGLEVLLDGKPDEEETYSEHHKVLPCRVIETGELPEGLKVLDYKLTEIHFLMNKMV